MNNGNGNGGSLAYALIIVLQVIVIAVVMMLIGLRVGQDCSGQEIIPTEISYYINKMDPLKR